MDVTFLPNSVPFSSQFNDVYYSVESGIDESHHVFIQGTQLLQRIESGQTNMNIAELGFGTGLNAMATLYYLHQCFNTTSKSKPSSGLHVQYHAIEGFPMSPDVFAQSAVRWEPFLGKSSRDITQAYCECLYQPVVSNRVTVTSALVTPWFTLHLWLGDVEACLKEMMAYKVLAQWPINTWYLDGFSPAKNPQMWTDSVFQFMAELSQLEARLATYTAAGFVRRGLQAQGFDMTKLPGFGSKRDMLAGVYRGFV